MKISFLLEDNSAQVILRPETAADKQRIALFRGDGRQSLRIKHTAEAEALVIEAGADTGKAVVGMAFTVDPDGAIGGPLATEREYLERNNA